MASKDVLLVEGDSWCTLVYPRPHDEHLTDRHGTTGLNTELDRLGFEVQSCASPKHTLNHMAYDPRQIGEFKKKYDGLSKPPKVVIFSGGGNDIVKFLPCVLKRVEASQNLPCMDHNKLNDDNICAVLRILECGYREWLYKAKKIVGGKTRILIHGYDYCVPNGKGRTILGGLTVAGPWLEHRFEGRGHTNQKYNTETIQTLLDRINDEVLKGLDCTQTGGVKNVTYVNLRGILSNGPDYREWWDDELHPTIPGYRKLAKQFEEHIADPSHRRLQKK